MVQGPGPEGARKYFAPDNFVIAIHLCSAFLWHSSALKGYLQELSTLSTTSETKPSY